MKNIKNFNDYVLCENVNDNEIPADGTYTGWCCGSKLYLDGKEYHMLSGVRARYDGEFVIKSGDVNLVKGTQYLGGKNHPLKIEEDEGLFVGSFIK